jgi:protoporphyrinogen oxidase
VGENNYQMNSKSLAILGGGPGGLAVGYFAKKRNIPFEIYESADRMGGNCLTLQQGEFFFDSGAHRFHDKIPEITAEIKILMGDGLARVDVPSQIYLKNGLVDFPLSPLNLLKKLGLFTFIKAGFEVLASKVRKKEPAVNFETFALRTYGKTIASLFLLNYSEKLWGAPCNRLSTNISGKRMKGLDLQTFLKEALLGSKAKTEHLDGVFYYPTRSGIGAIVEKLEQFCGSGNININSRVTRIFHDQRQILAVEFNGEKKVNTPYVVSSLPVNFFLQIMDPPPPREILGLGESLRFRNIVLVAIFLDMESVTKAASVYFPGFEFPFTRLYEARNRNKEMSPPGKTSVVVEIPCQQDDHFWKMADSQLYDLVRSKLVDAGLIRNDKIIGFAIHRMPDAYPILEIGCEEKIRKIFKYLKRFSNLRISGRNGKFLYTHIHDMMRFGKDIIDEFPFGKTTADEISRSEKKCAV